MVTLLVLRIKLLSFEKYFAEFACVIHFTVNKISVTLT